MATIVVTTVLGIHTGHDAAAAIVRDGRVVADAQEERFSRIKHVHGFPYRALESCLESAGLTLGDIDVVAVASKSHGREVDDAFGLSGRGLRARGLVERLPFGSLRPTPIAPPLHLPRFRLSDRCEIINVAHHRAHAASAEFTNDWTEPYLLVTADGIGDRESLTVTLVDGGHRTELASVGKEGSLGWFYGVVTEGLGWVHGDGEGKTMGMAPYGSPSQALPALRKVCPSYEHGRLAEERKWQGPKAWRSGGVWYWHFEESLEVAALAQSCGRENVAYAAQHLLEEELLGVVSHWLRQTGTRRLACAGGVFLNVKLNQRIWESGLIDDHHIFPNCGDSGLAAGAALEAYARRNPTWRGHKLSSVYWGPDIAGEPSRHSLEISGFAFRELDDPSATAASLIADGQIVAWVQGCMEAGPRALGNRSLLMNPARRDAKEVMNARVKFREPFRPFCPSLTLDAFDSYLVGARDEPFMVTSFDVEDSMAATIPAVVHVDQTMRPQAVTAERNERYSQLLEQVGERTGHPVVLNTSFNVRGEPMVNSPFDALRAFAGSGIDHLVLDRYLVSKRRD